MVRHYKRKRVNPLPDEEQIRRAVSTVLQEDTQSEEPVLSTMSRGPLWAAT